MLSFLNDLWGGERRSRGEGIIDEMQLAMDALPIGVALADATAVGDPVVYVNPRFAEVAGVNAKQVIGMPLGALPGGEMDIFPVRDTGGKLLRRLGVLSEARELRRIVAEMTRRSEEAERTSLAKSRFFASASHDLRQPLQALALFTSALDTHVTSTQGRTILGAVKQSLATMDQMFESMLDMSRIEAGVLRAEPRIFIVNDLLERLEVEFLPQATDKGLRLKVVRSSAAIHTDPALLARILRNFLSNAVRYTDRGKIIFGCLRRGPKLAICVGDSGSGIAEDQRQAIFEEYFQGRQRRAAAGMGLGLAIVRRLADLLGHGLQLRSVPGRGSLFSVVVPLAEGPPIDQWPAEEPAPSAGEMPAGRVMIVDDDQAVREGLSVLLKEWGCLVTAAASGSEALARLHGEGLRPDVILADLRLPEPGGGVRVIRDLQSALRSEIPAFLLTGDAELAEAPADVDVHRCAILRKPVNPLRLRAILVEAMALRRSSDGV